MSSEESKTSSIRSIIGRYTKPPEPSATGERTTSRSLKYRPARLVTKARIKNDLTPGDEKIQEGEKLLAKHLNLLSHAELSIFMKSRERLRIRREDILTACDASLITLKTHIAPFLYNIKAREWYNAIESLIDKRQEEQPDKDEAGNAVSPFVQRNHSESSSFDRFRSTLSSIHLGTNGILRFHRAQSLSLKSSGDNALGMISLVPHPFEGMTPSSAEHSVIVEHCSPRDMSPFVEWLDDQLRQVDETQSEHLRVFLRDICTSNEVLDDSALTNIENVIEVASTLDPKQFVEELVYRRNACLGSPSASATAYTRSVSSSATVPLPDEVQDSKEGLGHADGLLHPFQHSNLRGGRSPIPKVNLREGEGRSSHAGANSTGSDASSSHSEQVAQRYLSLNCSNPLTSI
ncbi:unnamed protein product [Somion occarium]|uniref:Uncharacterized protein n=1 Tax=Somion occarium TaxID=3059160 RepID=A0ABP1DGM7_9APHY